MMIARDYCENHFTSNLILIKLISNSCLMLQFPIARSSISRKLISEHPMQLQICTFPSYNKMKSVLSCCLSKKAKNYHS